MIALIVMIYTKESGSRVAEGAKQKPRKTCCCVNGYAPEAKRRSSDGSERNSRTDRQEADCRGSEARDAPGSSEMQMNINSRPARSCVPVIPSVYCTVRDLVNKFGIVPSRVVCTNRQSSSPLLPFPIASATAQLLGR